MSEHLVVGDMSSRYIGEIPGAVARPGRSNRLALLLASSTLALSALPAHPGEIFVHGFGTIGAAVMDQPAGWAYERALNQRTTTDDFRPDVDSVIGLQLNYRHSEHFEVVGQATAAVLDDAAKVADFVDLAFVAWRPGAAWTARLGRVNLDAYLLSDHRDVGFTYQFIRPPVEYYSRMPASLDGVDVVRTWVSGDVQWSAKAYVGRTSGGVGDRRLKIWPLYGVMLSREAGGLQLRISALQGRYSTGIAALEPLLEGLQQIQALPVPQVAAEAAQMQRALTTKKVRTDYLAGAMAYDRHGWLLNAEINSARVKDRSSFSFTTGYLSLGRRFGPVSVFVMESVATRRGDALETPDWSTPLTPIDPVLAQQAQMLAVGAATAINRAAADQSTTSLGMRWDLAPRLALKAQWDHVQVRRDGSGLWRNAGADPATANVAAVALDFVF
jgi:hypothetical protein